MGERELLLNKVKFAGKTHSCPSCTGPTYCAMEDGKSSSTCWCMTASREVKPEAMYLYESCQCEPCLTGA